MSAPRAARGRRAVEATEAAPATAKRARDHSPTVGTDEGRGGAETKERATAGVAASKAMVFRGSALVANLPMDLQTIYNHTIRHMLHAVVPGVSLRAPPAGTHPKAAPLVGDVSILTQDVDTAVLTFQVEGHDTAQKVLRRLHNARVFGRRWKVEMHREADAPADTPGAKPNHVALLDAKLVPHAPLSVAMRALSSVHGFLTLTPAPAGTSSFEMSRQLTAAAAATGSKAAKSGHDHVAGSTPAVDAAPVEDAAGGDGVESYFVASFVDEGSALHARAVLSGRLMGSSGVRLYLQRRPS